MACVASLLALHRRCIVPVCASAVGDLIALVALAVYESCFSLQEVKPSPYIRSAPKRASRIVAAACLRYTATPSARPVVPSKSPSSAQETKSRPLESRSARSGARDFRTVHRGQTKAQASRVKVWNDVWAAAAGLGPRIGRSGVFNSGRVRLCIFRTGRALAKDPGVVVDFDLSRRKRDEAPRAIM